jgi:hypothetical protein
MPKSGGKNMQSLAVLFDHSQAETDMKSVLVLLNI